MLLRRAAPAILFLVSAAATGGALRAQVSFDRILRADKEPQNWLTYSGTPFNQRYSPLTQITPANVKNLELQWVWQSKSLEKFEATALAVDGVDVHTDLDLIARIVRLQDIAFVCFAHWPGATTVGPDHEWRSAQRWATASAA